MRVNRALIFAFLVKFTLGSLLEENNYESVKPKLSFSPHDLAFERSSSGGRIKACASDLPDDMVAWVTVGDDLSGAVKYKIDDVDGKTFFTLTRDSPCQNITVAEDKNIGHLTITGYNDNRSSVDLDTSGAYCRVAINEHDYLDVLDEVLGWIYFVAWIVSFYPQIWINFRRRSVVGLNLDYVSLNVLGFTCYSMYNCGLYYIPEVKQEYMNKNVHGVMPIKKQDIAFALLALISTLITGCQALIYERGGQKVSKPAVGIIGAALVFLLISLCLSLTDVITWLDYLYYFSYTKLAITLIKYIPQAYFNFRRKSTKGWSIGNILLDFTGGSLSMLQMIIDAFNYDDWNSLFSDFTKFALGLISILFDILFIIQHYVLYRNKKPAYEAMSENNSPRAADYVREISLEKNDNKVNEKRDDEF